MKWVLLFSLALGNCYAETSKNLLYELLQQGLLPRTWFTYPGRFSSYEKKYKTKNRIIEIINTTQLKLTLYVYTLDDEEILSAILQAKNRGVAVVVYGDKDSDYTPLTKAGIEVLLWKKSGIHHVKAILADQTLFTGTGNLSRQGLLNDSNGFIELRFSEERMSEFNLFLQGKYNSPVFLEQGIFFMNSPEEGKNIQSLLLHEIDAAEFSIDYLIFSHYDKLISHGLRMASSRGVRVKGIYNKPIDPEGKYLSKSLYGLESAVYGDGNEDIDSTSGVFRGGLLHHKTMLIDHKKLITGSYNYSLGARDYNKELLMITELPYIIREYEDEFSRILYHAEREFPGTFQLVPEHIQTNTQSLSPYCLDAVVQSGTLSAGKGIFKTWWQYEDWSPDSCHDLFSFSSATVPGISMNSGILPAILEDGAEFTERQSNQIIHLNKSKEILFGQESFPDSLPVHSATGMYSGVFEFKSSVNNLAGAKVYQWTPGRDVIESVVFNPIASLPELYETAMTLDASQQKNGLIFIAKNGTFRYFCYQTGPLSDDIAQILKSIAIAKVFKNYKESEIDWCIN